VIGRKKENRKNYLQKNDHLFTLFKRFTQGDQSAFVTLVEHYSDDLYIEAYKVTRNPAMANDIVQDVLSKIYMLDPSKFPNKNPMAWLIRITKNAAISEIRKTANQHCAYEERSHDFDARLEESDFSLEDLVVGDLFIDSLLSELDEISRKIIYLKAVYLWPHHLIAETLQLPAGTVRWKYKEARDKLLQKLDERQGDVCSDEKRQAVIRRI